ncbi:MAG: DUF2480 family protein [Flavobacteriaceae bacterium]|nr:DUF2480 family protein [Flavobacteriaceae bacterium]NVJ72581.1 DUF2480 family protein [Flavobacteriaceae bacterium]
MEEPIVNRVANSKLITVDLEELYPRDERIGIDISLWLKEGFILIEKEFRAALKSHDWSLYQNKFVFLYNSQEAIIPSWAYLLISTYLQTVAKKIVVGSKKDLDTVLMKEVIDSLDSAPYKGKNIIIKGCSKIDMPQNAYLMLLEKLQAQAQKILYGEACSSVPLYAKKN